MVAALECYLDGEATRRIRALWGALAAAGIPSQQYRPHVSLVAAEALDPHAVEAALAGLPAAPPPPLTFDYVGQFVGRVLWLGPAPTSELLAHHATVHARLEAAEIDSDPYYRPGRWVPHCTLSMRVPSPMITSGVRLCLEVLPIPAKLAGVAVADHHRHIYHPLPAA